MWAGGWVTGLPFHPRVYCCLVAVSYACLHCEFPPVMQSLWTARSGGLGLSCTDQVIRRPCHALAHAHMTAYV